MTTVQKESRQLRRLRWIHHNDLPMEQIRKHYELEKKLATRLRNASASERTTVYSEVYDELMQALPDQFYNRLADDVSYQTKQRKAALKMLRPYLNAGTVYLEVGPGDCNVALEVAKHVQKVYAVDVGSEITQKDSYPENFELIISDGTSIPVENESIDIVYSNQLMEHIHPDDVLVQLKNIFDALKPGGHYLCRTPNLLTGPHDISVFFDEEPTGFHLKEYTFSKLDVIFRKMGFTVVRAIVGARGLYLPFMTPMWPFKMLEKLLFSLPVRLRRSICLTLPHLAFPISFVDAGVGEEIGSQDLWEGLTFSFRTGRDVASVPAPVQCPRWWRSV